MNVLDIEKPCVGCGACVDVCPTSALLLQHNKDGFYEPVIFSDKCVNCSKCVKVCPKGAENALRQDGEYYYGWINDEDIRNKSTSGGAFTALANDFIEKGGVVFGAVYSEDKKAVLMASTLDSTLDALRVSKYCQSYPDNLYGKMHSALKENKRVMLTGTPCQISAARRIFGENENLLLVDFMCGGVTPDTAFSDYVAHMEKKYKSPISYINMRDKTYGWSSPHIKIKFENGREYISRYQLDLYYHYFYSPYFKNTPCTDCSFTNHTDADITVGDFWGFREQKLQNDDKGMSLICVYSEKGRDAFRYAKNQMTVFELEKSQVDYAFKEQKYSAATLKRRADFMAKVRENGFINATKKDDFKFGRIGVCLNKVLKKVLRKR